MKSSICYFSTSGWLCITGVIPVVDFAQCTMFKRSFYSDAMSCPQTSTVIAYSKQLLLDHINRVEIIFCDSQQHVTDVAYIH